MVKKIKLGVMLSGRGTNFQALLDACLNPNFPAEIGLVVSNQINAPGLVRAKSSNILRRGSGTNALFSERKDFSH